MFPFGKRDVRKLFRNIVFIFTIMSSSRSIAAARNRRAGDPVQQQQPPNRPGTSIGSSAAFQTQTQYGKKVPQQSQKNDPPPPPNPNVPFSKISVSDAIGLITLRLGKVEQYIIDTQHDSESGNGSGSGGGGFSLPENTQLVDNSVFTSIINRLDSIEKKDLQSKQLLTKIEQELSALNNKLNQYTIDTNTRLDDINDAFLILEEGQGKIQTDVQVQLQTEEEDDEMTLEETASEVPLNTNGD